MRFATSAVALLFATLAAGSCGGRESGGSPTGPSGDGGVPRDDVSLFRFVSGTNPFGGYTLFPGAEEFTDGRLNGSEAHRPTVRVSLNSTALGALRDGRLPAGAVFPAGSVVFKEVSPRPGAAATTYAVMYKDATHPLAGDGWVWAEFSPTGSVIYSVANRGAACISCHQREQGPRHDLVRTIERQR